MDVCSATASAVSTLAALLLAPSEARAVDCHRLTGMSFHDALIVETNDVTPPFEAASLAMTGAVSVTAPFCRVRGVITPSPDSNITFEVWLPPAGAWNGRYQGVGNGGFAGAPVFQAMDWALQGGYAVSGTDTGHSGASVESRWALGHPEKVEDLGWRAIHETAVASKAIVEVFYGRPPAYSYFSGCSTGGRQGLVEAQRFPEDYDGIVVGAPANYWPSLLTSDLMTLQAVTETPESWVSPGKVAALAQAALAACHAQNGVIDDPSQCRFDPASILCKDEPSDGCLTAPEVATVRRIYAGLQDAAGKSIYPGFPLGSEAAWSRAKIGPAKDRVAESGTYPFPTGFFRSLVFGDPDWDFRGIGPIDAHAQAVSSRAGRAVSAENPDLSSFRARGGKILQYHGWSDSAIPAGASIKYYESVAATMGGVDDIQSFHRLFLAPGMEHCGGGLGPHAVGAVFGQPPPSRDPEHDVVSALARWVEGGVAPAQITATLYRDDDPSKGIDAQRPWCAYPAIARYSGHGERQQAASYTCAPPRKGGPR